ncbi:MAG: hypothetical protein AB1416_10770, partial [Actinomycetota bacterium]
MMTPRRRRAAGTAVAVAAITAAIPATAAADHSWGGYHWSRTQAPLALTLVDSVDASWDASLATASTDWSASSVLDTTVVPGALDAKTRRRCPMVAGKVRVCDWAYGYNGWLGLASIQVSSSGHITQATTKLNDSYHASAPYSQAKWRNHVMCQEVGHTFGLGHQDESGADLGTCMDYSTDPVNSQHPNQHDFDQLELIYQHLDGTGSAAATPPSTGRGLERVRDDLWAERLGNGDRVFH